MFDVVVIGSGAGGYVAAIKGAQLGGKIAIVEGGKLGGTCLNVGCIPTKALVHSANTYQMTGKAGDYGIDVDNPRLNFEGVMNHKDETIQKLVNGVERLLKGNRVTIYKGYAKVPEVGTVEVAMEDGSKEVLNTENIILATGSTPKVPPISQESISNTISSDEALSLQEVPDRLLVIGGGVLGVEFACIWNAFGSKVEIVELMPSILPPIDEEISRRLTSMFRRKGINVNLGIYVKEIKEESGEKVVVAETKDGGTKEFRADVVLIAVGRAPSFGEIDLDKLGVNYDRKGIVVDDTMATSVPGIWAIGDVVGKTYLAPVASYEGIVAMENIFGHKTQMDYSVIPSCVFSIPECASVGLKESQAKEEGIPIIVSKFPFSANGRALAIGETEGLVKVLADSNTGKIVGMHILGPHADDLIHEGALAIKAGLTVKEVSSMIHAHPTLGEAVAEACHGAVGKPLHVLTGR